MTYIFQRREQKHMMFICPICRFGIGVSGFGDKPFITHQCAQAEGQAVQLEANEHRT